MPVRNLIRPTDVPRVLALLTASVASLAMAPVSHSAALPVFVDVTEGSGIRFQHSFGDDEMSNIIESAGSGCGVLDYDNDGWMDLFIVQIGIRETRLIRQ